MNALGYAHVMARLVNAPLWAHPAKAAIVFNVLAGRLGYEAMPIADDPETRAVTQLRRRAPEASRFVGEWPQSEEPGASRSIEPFRLTKSGVGVITVTGALINRGAFIGSYSGETSYEGIKHQLARAAADNRVKSLILDLETPGGEANGAVEAAQAVRAVAAAKPVIAVVNGMAASGGYALASGATKIIAAPSGVAGSIGVVMLHLDLSRQLDKEGVTPTLIVAGERKMDGNPLEPLTEAATATLRAEVNRYYEMFLETVAAGRGRRTSARAARDTEGRVYIGHEAVEARLADDVGTFEEVLSDLARRAERQGGRQGAQAQAARPRRGAMDPLLETQPEQGQAEGGADRAALAEAEARGGAGQIARFKALGTDPRIKGREAFALKLACEAPQMPADAIAGLCEQIPAAAAAPASIAERAAETGADAVSSAPMPADASRQAGAMGWDKAIAEANARILGERRRGASAPRH